MPAHSMLMLDRTPITGKLVLSAWVEVGHSNPLRVRITMVGGSEENDRVMTASTIDEVCAEVRGWLEVLLAGSAG
jgi:hypothetical protein